MAAGARAAFALVIAANATITTVDSHLAAGTLGGGTADAVWIAWFVLAVLSAAYVAHDAFTRNPELTVMK